MLEWIASRRSPDAPLTRELAPCAGRSPSVGSATEPLLLGAILVGALALRLWGAGQAHLIFDERAHWALAETIDLRPGQFHLVSRTLDHPLLSIYVLRFGSLLCGTSDFALRLPYVLAGTATVAVVYGLGRRAFSPPAGLAAAALLAVDQFHVGWSRVFMPEVLLLLMSGLVLVQFLRALEKDRPRDYALLGLLLGGAYLAKEPAILLLPALWLFLLVTPAHRRLLLQPRWYLAQAVFLLTIAPDVMWNAAQWGESYLYRDAVLAGDSWRLSWKSVSLYLGEWLRWLVDADIFGEDYEQGNVYVCHWLAGLVYLVAVVLALRRRAADAVRLLLVTFLVVFGAFFVLPGGGRFEPFWWASISLIPAVVCAGAVITRCVAAAGATTLRRYGGIAFVFLLLALFATQTTEKMLSPGPYLPRASVREFTADFLRRGHAALENHDLRGAEARFVYVLNIAGPNAAAYDGLAQVARQRGQAARAERFMEKCQNLEARSR